MHRGPGRNPDPVGIVVAVTAAILAVEVPGLRAADCNGNGIEDALDLKPGFAFPPSVLLVESPGGPDVVILEDFDGDGRPDLATTNWSGVSVIPSRGGRTFAEERISPVPDGATAMEAADLDGDGRPDAVVVASPDAIAVLRNGGDGIFGAAQPYPIGEQIAGHAVADIDRDGHPDIIVSSLGGEGGILEVLRNDGEGRFASPAPVDLPAPIDPGPILAADLDRDGDQDLAIAGWAVEVLINRGNGTFRDPVRYLTGASRLDAADLDGDGALDLVFGGGDGIFLFPGIGDGDFRSATAIAGGEQVGRISLADLDGDGRLDILAPDTPGLRVLVNGGPGGFEDLTPVTTWWGPTLAAARDLDGDGIADIAACMDRAFELFWGTGGGRFRQPGQHPAGQAAHGLALADFDGDGRNDMAVGGPEGTFILLGTGGGSMAPPVKAGPAAGADLMAVDLDGDGRLDLAASKAVLRNAGNGTFGPPASLAAPGYLSVAAGDIDGDGKLDLAVAGSQYGWFIDTPVAFFRNDGKGSFPDAALLEAKAAFVAAGDFEGDGRIELARLSLEFSGRISFLRRAPDGTFAHAGISSIEAPPAPPEVADIDGDGASDIALPPDRLFLGRDRGNLWQESALRFSLPPSARLFVAADVDGDGLRDLVAGGHGICVIPHLGSGSFGGGIAPILLEPRDLAAADIDGDGRTDIAAVDGGRSIAVFRNEPLPPRSRDEDGDGVPDECKKRSFHRGDATGEGRATITDAIRLLGFLFLGGPPPGCREAADFDDDGRVDISDAMGLLDFLFLGGPPPAPPGPPAAPCGPDPQDSPADLGCDAYAGC
jgi:hypothetical protein